MSKKVNNKLTHMYNQIKTTIDTCIIKDTEEFNNMLVGGLTTGQRLCILITLENELNEYTNNKKPLFCNDYAHALLLAIEAVIYSLIKINKITEISAEELSTLIFNTITYHLEY